MDDSIEQLIPAVEQQLSSSETPYVGQTYRRLLEDPTIDEHEAKLMISLCPVSYTHMTLPTTPYV